jgi:hypothetical protein
MLCDARRWRPARLEPAFIPCAPPRTGRAGPVATTKDSPGGQADTAAADYTTNPTGTAGDGWAYGPVLCTPVQLLRLTCDTRTVGMHLTVS